MRIVAISDTHTLQNQVILPDGDVLIHAGDLTGRGRYHEFVEVAIWLEKLKDKFKHRIIIAGNHDFGFQDHKIRSQEAFDRDVIYLEDNYAVIDGVMIYGSPWTLPFYNWAFMKPEEELVHEFAKIHICTDVLVTHSPPFGILDKNAEQMHCGSVALYDRVKELAQLKHHIFGHIHASYGVETIDDVTFHNVCSLNEQYRYANAPHIIEV